MNRDSAGYPEMMYLPKGAFTMGSSRFYPEEAPERKVNVDGFYIDINPVTNAQFARFVDETGYRTLAEIAPSIADYPEMLPEMAQAGSLVFRPPPHAVDINDPLGWWEFCFGAWWGQPLGPGSTIDGLESHPVVHVALQDAEAYAAWAGKSLPTEAEWEYAARGGLEAKDYAWGDELAPSGEMLANYWQGDFPGQNTLDDGWERTSPVGTYPANPFGLHDMIGNVWEWTADWYGTAASKSRQKRKGACCVPINPRGAHRFESFDPLTPDLKIPRKVLKGGSHLCAANYCERYRPAARYPQPVDTSTSHVGFRCVVRNPGGKA